jgi:uncharacterized membrane protein
MLRSLLIGLVAGSRALTPLAAVSDAARRGALPANSGAPHWLGHPAVAAGSKLLAAGELWGDKLEAAPDRIAPAGIVARIVTGGLAGAALAPRGQAWPGGLIGATAAVGAAYLTFGARRRAMRRFGQKSTGLVEDALTVGASQLALVPSHGPAIAR